MRKPVTFMAVKVTQISKDFNMKSKEILDVFKELGYENYNHLQEFYGYYRTRLNYQTIDGVDITVQGSDQICLRDLRLVPHIEPEIVNPTLHFGETSIKIYTKLATTTNLYFDGKECVVEDSLGNVLERPRFEGAPRIPSGRSEVLLDREESVPRSRARLTVICEGEALSAMPRDGDLLK